MSFNKMSDSKKSIVILFVLNISSYVHIFYLFQLLGFMNTSYDVTDMNLFWIFLVGNVLPYIFLGATSFVLAKGIYGEYEQMRVEAYSDWFLRLFSYILVFQHYRFKVLVENPQFTLLILVILMLLSFVMEYRMFTKAKRMNIIKEITVNDVLASAKEIHNLSNMEKAIAYGYRVVIFYGAGAAFLIGIPMADGSMTRILFAMILSFCFLIWSIKDEMKRLDLYHLDKNYAKKLFRKHSVFLIVGYFMTFITGSGLFHDNLIISDMSEMVALLFFVPIGISNYRMAVRAKKIRLVYRKADTYE